MVGRSMDHMFPPLAADPSAVPVLEARHLSQPGVIENIDFTLHEGEVLGLAGLMGSGRSELARILFGLDHCRTGEILLKGESIRGLLPRRAYPSRPGLPDRKPPRRWAAARRLRGR